MTAREEAARRFADLLGWTYLPEERLFFTPPFVGDECDDEIEFPAPDAPLHEHLAFVGRVAEAIDAAGIEVFVSIGSHLQTYVVKFAIRGTGSDWQSAEADDLGWAAMLAASSAREGER